jgi:hypothetical protein
MNGKAQSPGDIRAMMEQMAQQNQRRLLGLSQFLGLSGVALQLLGVKLVRCTCLRAGCSGHAIQFDNRAHFMPNGIEMIPRPDAAAEEAGAATATADLAAVKGS